MSWFLFCEEVKTMVFPSGDHLGALTSPPENDVNCSGFDPSLLATQIWAAPDRCDMKASLRPSGESCGLMSRRLEATTLWAGWDGMVVSLTQMFVSRIGRM